MIKNAIGICTSVRNLQHVKNPNYVLILHLLATVFGQFLAQVSQFEKRLHFWSKLIVIQDGRRKGFMQCIFLFLIISICTYCLLRLNYYKLSLFGTS